MYGHPRRSRRGQSSEAAQALGRIDRAVVEAHSDLLATGENVSAWKVAQATMLKLQANSWDSLGFPMQQVPSLFRIMVTEGKVISFIHCFVGVQRVTSLYDLQLAICESEGVQRFEELELGPLLRHPLVLHYFSVGSGVTEVFKITTEEILAFLSVLIWKRRKKITPDDLLNFIAKKKKLDKENLCLRIQSLGMHISRIFSARQSENFSLKKCLEALEVKLGIEDNEHENADEHHDNMDVQCSGKISSQNMNGDENEVRCSDPSVADEKPQVGFDTEKDICLSPSHGSIRTIDHHVPGKIPKNLCGTISLFHVLPKTMPDGSDAGQDLFVDNHKNEVDKYTSMFIKLWRDTCRGENVREAVQQMIDYYQTNNKRMGKIPKTFLKYPYIGLLNVGVASIKLGMWDARYEASQAFSQQGVAHTTAEKYVGYGTIESEKGATDAVVAAKPVSESEHGVSVEDILMKVCSFLDISDDFPVNENPHLEKKLIFLRKLCKCQCWLTEQFSVKDFDSLGFGDFFMFLAKHISLLPNACQEYFLADDTSRKPSLEATMSQHHLGVFLSQASACLTENKYLSKQRVSELLMMQFPSVCFTLVENGPLNDFLDTLIKIKTNVSSSSVLFSATLTACDSEKSYSGFHITTKDAIEVLLTAPMLIDLNAWAFWDVKFAPSLGPLVHWLLSEVKTKELMCLVTKGGKVLRLDHSATLDSFLDAFHEGSSFQTAVNLLSLFALYGGEWNIPVSLLKCHAEKAFAFLLKGSTDSKVDVGKKYVLGGLKRSRSEFDTTIPLASRFTLECLGYLPEEFRSFAANLLLTGFQAIVKDAPSAILAECKRIEECLILHELGSSLGIVEWINDNSTLSLSRINKSSKHDRQKYTSNEYRCPEDEKIVHVKADCHNVECKEDESIANTVVTSAGSFGIDHIQHLHELQREKNSAHIIESIRREEFGLDPNISASENGILRKQHARLGRALHCLSQELYSQDSHFLLELVQNADDNVYPRYVEPTLIFILQEGGIVVLNNEQGFSTENIRALCDVGNSTKKGSTAGYIGKKGIGFKSVFRVTDAPEIHSNGFHIKFDLSEGQIGFVLPTIVPPCDVDLFSRLVSLDTNQTDQYSWNTCIVLPFRSQLTEAFAVDNITSMFSDLHPSLLLFLHRLECIKFRNMLTNSLTIMRKEIVGDGIVNVSFGKENMTWFVESRKLQVDLARDGVQTTQISIAFALEVSSDGAYIPKLEQQCVFAFLPLRTYGLKFIIQGDFILPSSREEVDGDSPWNQWLLSEFPNLFVSAERSFCSLSGFRKNPGTAISAFMSFVPLVGEVHGFFSSLPRMIISKLCTSNCLLLEGDNDAWVPPCKVLRNWTEHVRAFLPDTLVSELLGLGYLNKDIFLSDSLARSLGIEDYGSNILFQIISSLCRRDGGIKSMGLSWLSSWLNALYETSFHNARQSSVDIGGADVINNLRKIPFIPLLDGTYGSISEGAIWLNIDALSSSVDNVYGLEAFPNLFAKLRIVTPALFDGSIVANLSQILYRVGVQQLSTHEVAKAHVLAAISDEKVARGNKDLMMEYLYFLMVHLQSSCPSCSLEREHIISEIYNKALILTNHGYKRLADVPIHFSKDFGNNIDVDKLIDGVNVNWFDVDLAYLKYPLGKSSSRKMLKWRTFLKELGVSDFVRVVQVEKAVADMSHVVLNNMSWDREILIPGLTVQDWESQELVHLLSQVSSSGDQKRCKYLLKVLDTIWDDYFSDKATALCNIGIDQKTFKSSLVSVFNDVRWIASSVDNELHYPGDLFHDCEAVRSLLGDCAPYAVPKLHNEKLPTHIGFKTCVTTGDILSVLDVWRRCGTPFKASVSQMSKFYTFIWNEMASSKQEMLENLRSGPFIFVPILSASTSEEVVPGVLLSPQEVYWHDDTGSVEQIEIVPLQGELDVADQPLCKMLGNIYPGLHDFFVDHCGVNANPSPLDYFQILLRLSTVATPSQAAKRVFQVFLEWADCLESGILNSKDVEYLKGSLEKKESRVLPTAQDKWVSLHPSFGFVCWCDDEKLTNEFEGLYSIDFLSLCELSDEEKKMLHTKVSVLLQKLGIPCLSEVVTREVIYYGAADNSFETSLVTWALPYAQRYIHNAHPRIYSRLKLSGFAKLNRLRIVVVEKLFFRNVIKRCKIASKKRFECNCLLQGDILYTTPDSVSHSVFMELSSFLLDGVPELHLANFLHMVTTMAESGSTEEQTEFFILNSQNVPRLPQEEQVWCLQSTHDSERKPVATRISRMIDEKNSSNSRRNAGANTNWPPVNWRTAPKMSSSDTNTFVSLSTGELHIAENIDVTRDNGISIEIDTESTIEEIEGLSSTPAVSLENSKNSENDTDGPNCRSSNVPDRKQLCFGTVNAHLAAVTGRRGELVAFKHLSKQVGEKLVKWLNKEKETGQPYDIVVGDEEKGLEYIEVKTTNSPTKDWFEISVGEWQFAADKGESFSIVHVVLVDKGKARVSTYKNPVKLCRLGRLQLAVLMPNQGNHVSFA